MASHVAAAATASDVGIAGSIGTAWPREVQAAVQVACLEVDGGLHGAATAAGVANPANVGALPLGGAVLAALLTIDGCPLVFQILVGDAR